MSFLFERDDDLFPALQVFHLDHTVGISGLQKQRALQSVVLPPVWRFRPDPPLSYRELWQRSPPR